MDMASCELGGSIEDGCRGQEYQDGTLLRDVNASPMSG